MKKIFSLTIMSLAILAITSCQSTKNIAYIQNSDSISYDQSRFLYDAKIMPLALQPPVAERLFTRPYPINHWWYPDALSGG